MEFDLASTQVQNQNFLLYLSIKKRTSEIYDKAPINLLYKKILMFKKDDWLRFHFLVIKVQIFWERNKKLKK